MTRFARAKGSKSSNERLPNDPTPWHVMKQQLEDNSSAEKSSVTKSKSAKELLKEKDDPFYCDSLGNLKYDWAEIEVNEPEVTQNIKKKGCNVNHKTEKKCNKTKDIQKLNTDKIPEKQNSNITEEINKKLESQDPQEVDEISFEKQNIKLDKKEKLQKRKREKSLSSGDNVNKNVQLQGPKLENEHSNEEQNNYPHNQLSKRQKRNMKKTKSTQIRENNTFNISSNDWDNAVKFDDAMPTNNTIKFDNTRPTKTWKSDNRLNEIASKGKRKAPKVRDDKEHKRRKPDNGSIKMTINGVDVEIVKYDGFPVRIEDAERLKDLREQMIIKGIPKSEINAAMKLERRKAEKVLARLRRCVCFHCRKSGHNLSDCPDLGKEQAGTGICFKCGSTEHTHFECKVTRTTEYRFATCFICREQGHIAKQCPDNPKGIYPDGGACKVCGDVIHLKKDCPDLQKEKEETTITLGTISSNALESLD